MEHSLLDMGTYTGGIMRKIYIKRIGSNKTYNTIANCKFRKIECLQHKLLSTFLSTLSRKINRLFQNDIQWIFGEVLTRTLKIKPPKLTIQPWTLANPQGRTPLLILNVNPDKLVKNSLVSSDKSRTRSDGFQKFHFMLFSTRVTLIWQLRWR